MLSCQTPSNFLDRGNFSSRFVRSKYHWIDPVGSVPFLSNTIMYLPRQYLILHNFQFPVFYQTQCCLLQALSRVRKSTVRNANLVLHDIIIFTIYNNLIKEMQAKLMSNPSCEEVTKTIWPLVSRQFQGFPGWSSRNPFSRLISSKKCSICRSIFFLLQITFRALMVRVCNLYDISRLNLMGNRVFLYHIRLVVYII